ncbi:hypothetical protein [Halorubrum trueperi]|uniref:Uncharacterized protein n=1 Tax=Halorubrum trueperi TaxID=2004704 RepID=A0ABD5UL99_9EURY
MQRSADSGSEGSGMAGENAAPRAGAVGVVGPVSDEERDSGNRKIKVGFLLLVAVSPPLIALQWDPTPIELLAALASGVLLGLLLVWYLGRLAGEFTAGSRRPGRRRR